METNTEIYDSILDNMQKTKEINKKALLALLDIFALTHSLCEFDKDIKHFKKKISECLKLPNTIDDFCIYYLYARRFIETDIKEKHPYYDWTFVTEPCRTSVKIEIVADYDYTSTINSYLNDIVNLQK